MSGNTRGTPSKVKWTLQNEKILTSQFPNITGKNYFKQAKAILEEEVNLK